MAFNRIKLINEGLDELIFQGRHKAYGAYMLRREYYRKLMTGLLFAVALVILTISLPMFIRALFPPSPKIVEIQLSENPCYNVQLPEAEAKQRCVSQSGRLIYPKIKDRASKNDTTAKENSTLGDTGNSSHNQANSSDGNSEGVNGVSNIEVMPSFPGGLERMNEFIRINTNYPRSEQKERNQGIVDVGFMVRSSGELSGFHIIRGVSKGLDDEALRVIKMMPEWNPGMQKGKPVDNVPASISITFKL